MSIQPQFNLALPFWAQSQKLPEHSALVADQVLSYGQLAAHMQSVAGWLGPTQRVAILASRSAAACIAVLACAWKGCTYLPLGLDWPEERLLEALRTFQPQALLMDERGEARLGPALRDHLPELQARADLVRHRPLGQPAQVNADDPAYVIFTSGSSASPRGVVVRALAVRRLMQRLTHDLHLNQPYRTAGNFELSFDGSVLDMFACWENGGALYLVPPQQAMAPHSFLAEHRIQAFLLTPAHLHMMLALKAPVLPELRWCAFGADALPVRPAQRWRELAPAARIFNLYGPTEGTVVWMAHELQEVDPGWELIPIGRPLSGLQAEVLPETGELKLIGDQVALGYLNQPDLSQLRFGTQNGQLCYRTGDQVWQDAQGLYHFKGRLDHQVKIRGYRVELEEVERALREADPACQAAALAWPDKAGQLNQLVAFVARSNLSRAELLAKIGQRLPEFMLPSQLHFLEQLPLNANGKTDRAALRLLLKS